MPARRPLSPSCPRPRAAIQSRYCALPVVTRFNHQDGIAPYNGVVAITTNSRAEYGRIWQTWLRGLGQPDSYRCLGSRLDYSGLLVRILETAMPLSTLRAKQPSKRLVQD